MSGRKTSSFIIEDEPVRASGRKNSGNNAYVKTGDGRQFKVPLMQIEELKTVKDQLGEMGANYEVFLPEVNGPTFEKMIEFIDAHKGKYNAYKDFGVTLEGVDKDLLGSLAPETAGELIVAASYVDYPELVKPLARYWAGLLRDELSRR
jgi:hypothetical protein